MYDKIIPVRMPDPLLKKLDEICEKTNRSRNYVILKFIQGKIDEIYPELDEMLEEEEKIWKRKKQ